MQNSCRIYQKDHFRYDVTRACCITFSFRNVTKALESSHRGISNEQRRSVTACDVYLMGTNDGNISSKGKKAFNSDKYMDIDEFIQVLREAELITPFGRLQTHAGMNQGRLENMEGFSHCLKQSDYSRSRKSIIPLTPVVWEVFETERNLRDIDTKTSNAMPYGPLHTKKIVHDSVLTNYLLLLSDKEETS